MVDVGLRRRADDGRRDALLPLAFARHEHAVAREAQIHGVARRHGVGVGEFRIDRGHHGLRRQVRLALRDGREGRGHRGGEKIEIVEGAKPIRRAHARDVDAHAPTLGRRRGYGAECPLAGRTRPRRDRCGWRAAGRSGNLDVASHAASSRKTPPGLEGSKGMRALAGAWEVLFISFAYPFPSAFGAALGCEKLWERSAETGLSAIGSNEDANYERKRKSYPPQDSFRGNSNWFLRSHLTDESYPRKLPNCFVAIETRYINEIE